MSCHVHNIDQSVSLSVTARASTVLWWDWHVPLVQRSEVSFVEGELTHAAAPSSTILLKISHSNALRTSLDKPNRPMARSRTFGYWSIMTSSQVTPRGGSSVIPNPKVVPSYFTVRFSASLPASAACWRAITFISLHMVFCVVWLESDSSTSMSVSLFTRNRTASTHYFVTCLDLKEIACIVDFCFVSFSILLCLKKIFKLSARLSCFELASFSMNLNASSCHNLVLS